MVIVLSIGIMMGVLLSVAFNYINGDPTQSEYSFPTKDILKSQTLQVKSPIENTAIADLGNGWRINKTGAEEDLDVTVEKINDTAINVSIKYPDDSKKQKWKKYYDDYNQGKSDNNKRKKNKVPVSILESNDNKLKINKNKIDLDSKDIESFVVNYDPSQKDYSFKIGWESVQIESATDTALDSKVQPRSLVWKDNSTGYVFYINSDESFVYRNSTDAGSTWAGNRTISTATIESIAVWYDKWTSEASGDLVHLVYIDSDTDDIIYRNFDISNFALSSEVTVFNGATASTGTLWSAGYVTITKSRYGDIYVGGSIDGDTEEGFWRSIDGGSSFSSKSDYNENSLGDRTQFLPGNEINDSDIWAVFFDNSDNDLTLKVYNTTANAWTETGTIDADADLATNEFGFDSTFKHSNNHSFVTYMNDEGVSSADLEFWELENSSLFTAKTDVVTNNAQASVVGILLDQNNNNIYVSYVDENNAADVYYKNSSDNGTTWSSAILYDDHTDDINLVIVGTSVGTAGGRFQPIFYNDDLFDLYTNHSGGIDIPSAAGADTTPPGVTINDPNNQTYTVSTVDFNFTLSESGICNYTLNSGTDNFSMSGNAGNTEYNATNTSIGDGGYRAYAYCEDDAGNLNHTTFIDFNIDTSGTCDYGGTGNWDISTSCNFTNVGFNISGNLSINSGGTLNLTNVTLNFNKTEQFIIFENVADEDKLILNEFSRIN